MQISRGSFGCLHQILYQLFQPLRLPFQYRQVFLRRLIWHLFLFQQVHIVDNGGERRFDIVGDICNELCFHALAFQPLLHCARHSHANVVERSCMLSEEPAYFLRIEFIV